jgi:vesicle-fusing ATPase
VADARLHRLDESLETIRQQLARRVPDRLEIVPLRGPVGADFPGWAAALTSATARSLWPVAEPVAADTEALTERSTLAWLAGADLLLPEGPPVRPLDRVVLRCVDHAVRWFVPVHGTATLAGLPSGVRRPDAVLLPLGYDQRLTLLLDGLGVAQETLRGAAAECARRFRLEAPAVRRITADLHGVPGLDAAQLAAACRGAVEGRHDDATQHVTPRFTGADLILPPAQMRQFSEIRTAMRMLAEVHYGWGTARVWNESGLSVLFCGPPGTGKTMAAEALASELALDLYRIDLSQVVNKYIGETEKNLRRVFDAAEASDCILFFDEADALFGKRTEVKDAHDRFANIEIAYLLERMERFKGLAILATNRRKDLDEAFLRRLRYVLEFPTPGVVERERIWRAGIPPHVDAEALDFHFLAKQFAFTGGHIRSVIFNACLQAANSPPEAPLPAGKVGRLRMRDVLVQVKRELDKLNRAAGDEQFGIYAPRLAEWTT